MKISTRYRYALHALMEMAHRWGRGYAKRKQMAEKRNISDSYLENILVDLKAHGIVRSERGSNGGYALTRDPASISLLDVMNALEGSMAPVDCVENESACMKSADCVLRGVYRELKEAQEAVLGRISLQTLLERSRGSLNFSFSI